MQVILIGLASTVPGKTKINEDAIPPINAIATPIFGTTRASNKQAPNHVNVSMMRLPCSVRSVFSLLYFKIFKINPSMTVLEKHLFISYL